MSEFVIWERLEELEKRIAQHEVEIAGLKKGLREVGHFAASHIHPGHAQTLPWAPIDTQPASQAAGWEEG